jgi:hypothetical protein
VPVTNFYTVTLDITEPHDTDFFVCYRQFPFHTGVLSLDHRDCKSFPVYAGFVYAKVPFKTGLAVFLRKIYRPKLSQLCSCFGNANGSESHILSLLLGR